eukprot:scaffold1697_cov180-Amphora_coffeaeformis.AAC.11
MVSSSKWFSESTESKKAIRRFSVLRKENLHKSRTLVASVAATNASGKTTYPCACRPTKVYRNNSVSSISMVKYHTLPFPQTTSVLPHQATRIA